MSHATGGQGGLRPVDEYLAECLAAIRPLPVREATLLDALGCVVAADVKSTIAIPRFDNSSMDGYAVHSADLNDASPQQPVTLPVRGDIAAGDGQSVTVEKGTTWRIMTGAPMPAGADAVVPVEYTDRGTETVRIGLAPASGRHVRRIGEDVVEGEIVIRAGERLAARHIALLAAVGRHRVLVHPRPKVLVLPSGSELVPPGKPLRPGQIHDSNGYGLVASVQELGVDVEHGGIMTDEPERVAAMLEEAADEADLVITTGGVSAGAYDTVKEVLSELGTVGFFPVAMQPGKPQGFGLIEGEVKRTPIFTLPGNPVSALVSFEIFVRPALRMLAGLPVESRERPARAAVGWRSPAGKRQYVRATWEQVGGESRVTPVGGQGSHLVADLAGATCLAVVKEQVTQVVAGDELTLIELGP